MNATDIRGYAYDAALHCVECTHAAMLANTFTREPPLKTETDQNGIAYDLIDSEGNPVSPLFADQGMSDDTCDDCGEELP